MSWDDLEPGQDDLVKDGRARKKIKRAVRNARPGLSEEEARYTDHNAGDPGKLTPNAERARPSADRGSNRSGSPVRGGILERFRGSLQSLRDAWDEAYQDAQGKQQQRQQERRARKGK